MSASENKTTQATRIVGEVLDREGQRVERQVANARAILWSTLGVVSLTFAPEMAMRSYLRLSFVSLTVISAAYVFFLRRATFRTWMPYASALFDAFVVILVPVGNAMFGGARLELLGVTPATLALVLTVCLAGLRQSASLVLLITAVQISVLGVPLISQLRTHPLLIDGTPLWGLWMVRAVVVVVIGLVVAITAANGRRLSSASARALGEYDELMRLFGRYVAPEIRDQALRLNSAPKTMRVTVLFTDLRSFTSLSEQVAPRELLDLLNEHFAAIVPVIHAHGGTVNKFIGDAVMATFGAPLPLERHAQSAVDAGIALLRACDELNAKLASAGRPQLITGVGIATGPVVVGTLGPSDRVEYAVLGDTVNLAARLEGENKAMKTRLLLSGATRSELRDAASVERMGTITVRGKTEPVEIFTIR